MIYYDRIDVLKELMLIRQMNQNQYFSLLLFFK